MNILESVSNFSNIWISNSKPGLRRLLKYEAIYGRCVTRQLRIAKDDNEIANENDKKHGIIKFSLNAIQFGKNVIYGQNNKNQDTH